MVDPTKDSASEMATAIREGQITARECLAAVQGRIDELNPHLNAIVTLNERAAAQAADADARQAAGEKLGPLHGVPFTVKDTLLTAGLRTTAGSAVLSDLVPKESATVVSRLEEAGAILVGKTNCSEFAVDIHSGNGIFGDTLNPLDPRLTSGGSSGGEAAAVASGMSAFGIGSDFGGSIRWPAHCTGLVSLRPTVGLVPVTGVFPFPRDGGLRAPNSASLLHRLMTAGPIARTVEDVDRVLRIIAGPDDLSPGMPPVSLPDLSSVDLGNLSIAWTDGEGTVPVRRDIVDLVVRAADLLAGQCAAVVAGRPPGLDRGADLFVRARNIEGMAEVLDLVRGHEEVLGPWFRRFLGDVPPRGTIAEQLDVAREYDDYRVGALRWFREHQILMLPVASVTAPPVGVETCDVDGIEVPRGAVGSACRAISILGFPSAVVPCGVDASGLPVGVQVVGRPYHDHEVLAVAAQLERVTADALTTTSQA